MLGWIFGGSKGEAELSKQLESARAELAGVKSAAEALLVSPSSTYDGLGHRTNYLHAREELAAYHGWPYVATKVIATRLAAQPITLSRVVKRGGMRGQKRAMPAANLEPIDDHPLLDLLRNPNPLGTRFTFLFSTAANVLLSARGFWWLTADDENGLELYWLPSSWIVGYVGSSRYEAWEVRPPGITDSFTVPAEEMTYFHLPDPASPHGARSPLGAVWDAAHADDEMLRSQVAGFKNGIFPRFGLNLAKGAAPDGQKTTMTLSGPQRRQLIESVRSIWGGVMRSQEPLIVGDGLIDSVIKLSATPHEMDWSESGKAVKARILQAFGVNPIVVGEIESANRASSTEAERHLIHNAVNPLAVMMSEAMTEWLGPMFAVDGERLVLTIEPCEVNDADLEIQRMQLAAQFGAVEINELRAFANLPPVDYGNTPVSPPGGVADAVGGMVDQSLANAASRALFGGKPANGKANGHALAR